jgi:hypothetical protein
VSEIRVTSEQVETLLAGFGYSVIDLGNLRDGGLIQQAGGPSQGEICWRKENVIDESRSSHGLVSSRSAILRHFPKNYFG